MWIWIVLFAILLGIIIFIWRVLLSTYKLIPMEKESSMFNNFSPSDISFHMETLRSIKAKLKSLEDRNAYFEIQLNKLIQKIDALEDSRSIPNPAAFAFSEAAPHNEEEEDWKELYYEENEKKEKLENQLDATEQELEALKQLLELHGASGTAVPINEDVESIKKDYDAKIEENLSLQNRISELEEQLKSAREKDAELESLQQEVAQLRSTAEEYKALSSENDAKSEEVASLESQINELREQLQNVATQKEEQEERINRLKEEIEVLRLGALRYESLKNDFHAKAEETGKLKEEINNLNNELQAEREKEQQNREKDAEIEHLRSNMEHYNALKSEYNMKLNEIQSLQNHINNLQNQLQAEKQKDGQIVALKAEAEQLRKKLEELASVKSSFDGRLVEIEAMQNHIGDMQRQLEAAAEKEKSLEIQLKKEIELKNQLAYNESILTSLRSENDGLKSQITEMALRYADIEKQLMKMQELESRVNSFENEKTQMISELEAMIKKTRSLNQ